MNKKILEILNREAEKRNQVVKEVKMDNGNTYYTCGELNIHKLAKTALSLIG